MMGEIAEPPRPIPGALECLARLEGAGVEWTLLRPAESLAAAEGDVDILIEPGARPAAERVLADDEFVLVPLAGGDTHAARFERESGRFLWLHVQTELALAGARLPAAPILAGAVVEGEVRVPGADWLLWILLLRALVDRGELPERHRPAVRRLAERWQGGPAQLLVLARRHEIDPDVAVARAAAGEWELLAELVVPARPSDPLWRRLPRAPRRLGRLRGWRDRRGISVAVLGPDGAGKSSLVEALARDLPLPSRVQYMGLTGGQLPRADALRVPGVVFVARFAIHWLRYGRGLRQMARGGIAIFDRYTLDAVAPSGMRLSPVARLSRRLQRHVVPLPDLVLVLDAPGEALHARSGEYTPEVLESWRRAFATLEHSVANVALLDATKPAEEVRREALDLVWRRYGQLRGQAPGR